ncbi:hypothetical protein ACF0H5_001420 [Mactra antiquata]
MESITCSVCNEPFSSRYSVRRHITRKHSDLIEGVHEPQIETTRYRSGAQGAYIGTPPPSQRAPGHRTTETPEHRCTGAPGAHFEAPRAYTGSQGHHFGAPTHHSGAPLPLPSPPPPQEEESVVFQHPFTMMISGPTVDTQSVMTLARQMYPGQCNILLKQFAKATKHPYGHLLVNLKPFTPENQRLKCFSQKHSESTSLVTPPEPIKEDVPKVNHSTVGLQTDHIEDKSEASENNLENNLENKIENNKENNSEEEMKNKGQACDDCGQLFDTIHDVQRHVKRGWCPESTEPSTKKRKYEELSDSDDGDSVEDNEAFRQLWKRARESNNQKLDQIYNRFIEKGEESDDAQEIAEERIRPYNEKRFLLQV